MDWFLKNILLDIMALLKNKSLYFFSFFLIIVIFTLIMVLLYNKYIQAENFDNVEKEKNNRICCY